VRYNGTANGDPFAEESSMTKRVLIVDDEPAFLLGIHKIMKPTGAILDLTDAMEEARKLLDQQTYDVVITDLRLTAVWSEEGLDLIRLVKGKNPATQCILITGYGTPEIREKAKAQGAAYYFEKPVPPEKLLEAVKALGIG
jgi:DNA-binding NtrC family response regulator